MHRERGEDETMQSGEMDSDDRLRGALNTLHEPWWRTTLARLFGRRVESDGHTWARWRGRYFFIR